MRNVLSRFRQKRGFTLVELAIVLAVTGILFFGLYRLLSGGNQQSKDTAVASQQIQLISAVKTFLASNSGQQWMGASGSNTTIALPLPASNTSNANCKASIGGTANQQAFCDSLPIGFTSATVNAYTQTFSIRVAVGPFTAPATVPSTYSFMILTLGGDTILDADGGRISSQIGSDGGFVYANANACAAGNACGAYGAWTVSPVAIYGYAGASVVAGHVASRTYNAPESNAGLPWLARLLIDPAGTTAPYNTMNTTLFLGGQQFYLGTDTGSTIGGGTIHMQNGSFSDPAIVQNNLAPSLDLSVDTAVTATDFTQGNPLTQLNTNCSVDANTATYIKTNIYASFQYFAGDSVGSNTNKCKNALFVNAGDVDVIGLLQATTLYAGSFIYQASDARLKTDIAPILKPFDSVMRLKPVSYTLKANKQKSMGFIAQDLEKVYPDLVTKGDEKTLKSVNYEGLIAPLAAAVQELKHQNDDLRDQLQQQSARQNALEDKLKKLEK